MLKLEDYVISIPDFPEEGIIFRDLTGILRDGDAFHEAVKRMCGVISDLDYDLVAGAEARGFVLASAIAYEKKKPLILIRKKGKLPRETLSIEYELEYGTSEIELHKEDVKPGQKVLLVDDLLATGGTLKAAAQLVEKAGGVVSGIVVLMELAGLNGRAKIDNYRIDSCIVYPGK